MSRGSLLIKGGRLVDPSLPLDALRDVRIVRGIVYEIGDALEPAAGEPVFDATNAVVAPGFLDMHVHLREPGFPEKETIATGTEAAVRGGFTAVACMPNTRPALDDPRVLDALKREASQRARCAVYPIAAITQGRQGLEPCDFAALAKAGAVGFSDDGTTVADPRVLRAAALQAVGVEGVFISHCEDERLKAGAVMNEGDVARALGVAGAPALAEDVIVARDLLIAAETGKAWHVAHLTTRVGLDLVRYLRPRAARVTCEVTPHHLNFTDEAVRDLGAAAKVNPPLRGEDDVRALREGVRDGTIDVFATDHAPHTAAEKAGDLAVAAVGFTGLEVAVGAYAAALADLPMLRFVALLSTNPAHILSVAGGTLAIGAPGDVTIFADRPWVVDTQQFASKGRCTPFAGRTLPRQVLATVIAGSVAYAA
ncbi:MAG: dihydroorotase [Candidatus Eremiobacteraeota bacterium]|nr:dihydroorotase [Candidatus Eremiobacteraeota bacterium]